MDFFKNSFKYFIIFCQKYEYIVIPTLSRSQTLFKFFFFSLVEFLYWFNLNIIIIISLINSNYSISSSVDKSKALSLVLHCCDIAHPSKRWDLHHRWTSLLLEEFFRQGDKERELGLPFSPLCDRNNTLVAESQIGEFPMIPFGPIQLLTLGSIYV